MDLVVDCYQLTKSFPKSEIYGLVSQLQRAAVSIPANISEGHNRGYTKEYLHHIAISLGSLAELETHLEIARRLNYADSNTIHNLFVRTDEIGRMLTGLKKSLK